ncbi:RtcB family protein [Candidatus Woesearchaeota archaeon]|nr:RtcB family protein [Candidatus Woesearchaeota archaeon]
METIKEIKQIDENIFEISQDYKKGMLVPGRIYASKKLLSEMDKGVIEQVTNVACLPGIQKYSLCMPDGHYGYGFPIGGVAAFDPEQNGIISPGGVGFDINCGIRSISTNLTLKELKPNIKEFTNLLFKKVPSGVGSKGFVRLTKDQFTEVMETGSKWCEKNGYATKEDLERTESSGTIPWADHSKVSDKAFQRGFSQMGTLGSGNHFLELQYVSEIYNKESANIFGIHEKEQVALMVHCGSRGFGHQIGTDYLKIFDKAMQKYNIKVPDRELGCAPLNSDEGQDYYKAMACAANMAFANRQVILHRIRECFKEIFQKEIEVNLVYDVAHNIAKLEEHKINNKIKKLIVHRKGATRAFSPNNKELTNIFQKTGQPIVLGGSMEASSYLLAGTQKAMDETFGSTAHGAGRAMSRTKAREQILGKDLQKQMEAKGIYVQTASYEGLAEEAGFAYKDVSEVISTLEKAGISKLVARFNPLSNIKG